MRKITTALALGALLLGACSGSDPGVRVGGPGVFASAASLERFDACPELLDYLREESTERVGPYGLQGDLAIGRAGFAAMDSLTIAERSTPVAAPAAGDDAGSFSTTNVQERDVDEPDIVKTDGRHIFTTRSDEDGRMQLVAVAIEDGRPGAAGTLRLPEGAGADLLVADERAVVLGGANYAIPFRGGVAMDLAIYPSGPEEAVITIVDISDPREMRVTDVIKLEGSYASARMVDGVVRIVLNTTTQERLELESPAEPTERAAAAALEHNRRVTRTAPIDAWLPRFEVEDGRGTKTDEGALVDCSATYHPKTFSGFHTTTVVTIDPDDPKPTDSSAVIGGAGIVYASTDNLYVATQRWPEPRPADLDPTTGAPDVFRPDPASTQIHRFDIRSAERASYAGSGEVRGTILNQWALSEHDGHLRVATTEDAFEPDGATASSSFVTVLDADGDQLRQVGQVAGIGPGERIYGVRFIGDVGYVVTFKQIDPLHVLDLRDPTSPKVVGELKIPGYSAYLHPVGDGLLLGVGQDVDPETTQPLGTQLSLFDVSDPASPQRIDDVRVDRSSTPVEHDHHAFTWWEPSKLAVVPVSRYDIVSEPAVEDREVAPESFRPLNAAIGYRIDGREITEAGRASHGSRLGAGDVGEITRSIVIGARLYTVSSAGVMSSELGSFAERGWFAFGR